MIELVLSGNNPKREPSVWINPRYIIRVEKAVDEAKLCYVWVEGKENPYEVACSAAALKAAIAISLAIHIQRPGDY